MRAIVSVRKRKGSCQLIILIGAFPGVSDLGGVKLNIWKQMKELRFCFCKDVQIERNLSIIR